MGFLDQVKNIASALNGQQQGALAQAAVQILGNQPGGVGGLVSRFEQGGLAGAAQSWVSTGPNQPVSPDQMHQVIGADQISAIAAKAGISPDIAKAGLATLLPILIDKATPNGKVPADGGKLASGLGGLLAGLTGG
jgi:uncharacterized protein YidB (DUF937 family)